MEHTHTFIDLFAGIGGFRRGFESIGGQCVFTSEWNKYSQQTYAANFTSAHHIAGDITQVDAHTIPDHDLLLAGFPCQPFSNAGVSARNAINKPHGFKCKTQGTLFFDVARILERKRPAAFVLENVKNLRGHNKGETFKIIMDTLQGELGYHVQHRIIDAANFLPQHRERIFIVGFREDRAFNLDALELPAPGDAVKLSELLHPASDSVADRYTITDTLWNWAQNYKAKHMAKGNGFGYTMITDPANQITRTLMARYYKDGCEILIEQPGRNPRRLSPRECSRLMGFDTPTGSAWNIPVSNSQAYKQFGNAVAVPVVGAIAEHMRPFITS